MKLLILVLGMVLILEGLPYAAAPEKMREWLLKLSEISPASLRVMGIISLCIGLLICWVVQKTSLFM
ncbi:MAG: DUF2065 domain-containing protein [Desulfobacterales bacterium]|nr:DUF2065 domain-containing protein [Deltaproteobacteria bacterium]NNK93516.1 DUF2065 domain-containing protein [Desulfobacterales bacterium]